MYAVDDSVLYGRNGVCRIVEIEVRGSRGEKKQYYVLRPVFKGDMTLYAPVGKEERLGIRRILTEQQVRELIAQMPTQPDDWVEDTRQRKELFDEVMCSGDRRRMICMIRSLHRRQAHLQKVGKQLGAKDVQYLKDAQRQIHDEFALVLQIRPDEVEQYILRELGEEE